MNEHSYNILNNFPLEEYNLLVAMQSIQEINSIYKLVHNEVRISTNLDDKDVYREKSGDRDGGAPQYALTHKALMKLSTAANGQVVDSSRIRSKVCEKCIDIVKATSKAPACGSCVASANVAYRVIMKFPELSGGWRIVQATREIDFSNMSNAKPGQIAKTKEFASEHAESKAMNRCIRKGLSIKNSYSIEELEKPFVVIYPVLDSKDADVKKALIAGAIASSNLLYGSGLMLNQGQQQAALPAGRPDVDMSTGEIIDNDYEAEQPEVGSLKPWENNAANQVEETYFCANPDCKASIAKNLAEKSKAEFDGYALCAKCQQQARKAKKEGAGK